MLRCEYHACCLSISCLRCLALCNAISLVSALDPNDGYTRWRCDEYWLASGPLGSRGENKIGCFVQGLDELPRGIPAESRQRRFGVVLVSAQQQAKLAGYRGRVRGATMPKVCWRVAALRRSAPDIAVYIIPVLRTS